VLLMLWGYVGLRGTADGGSPVGAVDYGWCSANHAMEVAEAGCQGVHVCVCCVFLFDTVCPAVLLLLIKPGH
jgi:hypothetical protein